MCEDKGDRKDGGGASSEGLREGSDGGREEVRDKENPQDWRDRDTDNSPKSTTVTGNRREGRRGTVVSRVLHVPLLRLG